jgi:asparagine synthase (glutamine-hydrolysing)
MCGICGEIRFDGGIPSSQPLENMVKTMIPRGPDAQGILMQNNLALGHRRLKILDLSEHAAQPMVDNALGLKICYNGEIYNFRELREELRDLGYSFFSKGDTEVLLKAYHAWGLEFVKKLNGMFAFAIAERDSGKVILGRDRLGIKPLYYAKTSKSLTFASSLPALLARGDLSTELDPVALHYYMTFHSVVPPPHTLIKSIRKLPPAHLMVIHPDGSTQQKNYWDLDFSRGGPEKDYEEWEAELLSVLRTSIQRRMVSDVRVGVLLSGGLDSSLVVGLLAEAGTPDLQTFSIGFESVGKEAGNEFQYSDLIAEQFGTRHHRIEVDSSRALPALEACVRAMSEPMVSHDCIGFYLLSEEVSKNVKVVQSGQGADEIFGGYHWYPPLMKSSSALDDYPKLFFDRDHEAMKTALASKWIGEDYSRAFVKEHLARKGAKLPIDQVLRLDTQVMLVDDPVKRVDNMTMAWGLEARVPFLDHEVVELAARIPAEFKIREGGKYVLKEAARKVIPSQVIDRPKGYFPVPALKYLRGPYLDLVRDILEDERCRKRGVFRPEYLQTLLKDPESHITPLRGSMLWQVALLEYWMQSHGINA